MKDTLGILRFIEEAIGIEPYGFESPDDNVHLAEATSILAGQLRLFCPPMPPDLGTPVMRDFVSRTMTQYLGWRHLKERAYLFDLSFRLSRLSATCI